MEKGNQLTEVKHSVRHHSKTHLVLQRLPKKSKIWVGSDIMTMCAKPFVVSQYLDNHTHKDYYLISKPHFVHDKWLVYNTSDKALKMQKWKNNHHYYYTHAKYALIKWQIPICTDMINITVRWYCFQNWAFSSHLWAVGTAWQRMRGEMTVLISSNINSNPAFFAWILLNG